MENAEKWVLIHICLLHNQVFQTEKAAIEHSVKFDCSPVRAHKRDVEWLQKEFESMGIKKR